MRLTIVPSDPRRVNDSGRPGTAATCRRLVLKPTAALEEFLGAAAAAGLGAPDAMCLAVERACLLSDADELAFARETARCLLTVAARRAQARHPLTDAQADYVRRLSLARPMRAADASRGLTVELSDRLLARIGGSVPLAAFSAGAVSEMIAWERAAVLDGGTMTEWGLRTLAAAQAHTG